MWCPGYADANIEGTRPRGIERYRILGFNLETGTAGRLTIQTGSRDDKGKGKGYRSMATPALKYYLRKLLPFL